MRTRFSLVLLVAFLSLGARCQIVLPPTPPSPSPSATPAPEPTPAPTPSPEVSPEPSPSPTPEPSPVPTPEPTPTPSPIVCATMPECGFGGGHEGPWGCCYRPTETRFSDAVEDAVLSTGVSHVTDSENFREAVVSYLVAHNWCAVKGGPEDEIGIKYPGDDSYSEQYDVIRGDGAPQVLHAASCSPARF